jgi:hypothetical protein
MHASRSAPVTVLRCRALVHESELTCDETQPTGPSPTDAARRSPAKLVIRLRVLHARTASLPRPAGLRARRPSPMINLYRKNGLSTRACRW